MPDNEIDIRVNAKAARKLVSEWADDVDDGGNRAVTALTVLAENHMKAEAPEGAGFRDTHLRDSIDTKPEGPSDTKVVQPFKRTREGWLLVRAIVGNPRTPVYTDLKPPAGPLLEWARTKLGDESAGWAVRESIFQTGHESFPNPFVDRSIEQWEHEVESVANQAIREALG